MRLVSIIFALFVVVSLVGCGGKRMPDRDIPIVDELEEQADEEILEDDSDLDVPTEIDEVPENIPVETPDATEETEPLRQPSANLNLDGLDFDLDESVDEEILEDDIEDLE